jgi:hypothetical protein
MGRIMTKHRYLATTFDENQTVMRWTPDGSRSTLTTELPALGSSTADVSL